MSKQTTDFLTKYKEIETALREKGVDVKDYEDGLPVSDSQKFRMCRNIRNYLSHNEGGEEFIEISPKMQSFLNNIYNDVKKDSLRAKDIMQKRSVVASTAPFIDVVKMLHKTPLLVVSNENDEYIGIFTEECLKYVLTSELDEHPNAAARKLEWKKHIVFHDNTIIVDKSTLAENLPANELIIVIDSKNKVLGYIPESCIH